MNRPDPTVRGVAVAAAITVAMAGTVTAAEPSPLAQPGGSPVLVEVPSVDHGTPKTATAYCPGGSHVYAAGASITGGDGGVVMTEMVPDPTLSFVRVRAAERSGHTDDWSVTAYAMCDFSTPPQLEPVTVASSAATATCPSGSRVVGLGFRQVGLVDESYVDQVVMGPELREVRVHAGGPGTPTSLTAIAICKALAEDVGGVRVEAPALGDAAWPRTASIAVATSDHWFYGVGAVASPGAHLTTLVPHLDPSRATARAELASELPVAATGGSGDGSEQEGSTTVYGILIGTFH